MAILISRDASPVAEPVPGSSDASDAPSAVPHDDTCDICHAPLSADDVDTAIQCTHTRGAVSAPQHAFCARCVCATLDHVEPFRLRGVPVGCCPCPGVDRRGRPWHAGGVLEAGGVARALLRAASPALLQRYFGRLEGAAADRGRAAAARTDDEGAGAAPESAEEVNSLDSAAVAAGTEASASSSASGDIGIRQSVARSFLDALQIRCPQCSTPLDPDPGGCCNSRCFHCGQHFCFLCFATGPDVVAVGRHLLHAHGGSAPPPPVIRRAHRTWRRNAAMNWLLEREDMGAGPRRAALLQADGVYATLDAFDDAAALTRIALTLTWPQEAPQSEGSECSCPKCVTERRNRTVSLAAVLVADELLAQRAREGETREQGAGDPPRADASAHDAGARADPSAEEAAGVAGTTGDATGADESRPVNGSHTWQSNARLRVMNTSPASAQLATAVDPPPAPLPSQAG